MAKRLTAAAMAAAPAGAPMAHPESLGRKGAIVRLFPVADLVRHPRNARAIMPSAAQTKALVDSVRTVGVLLPVLVAKTEDGKLGVLAGWQRVSAARAAGLAEVPAIVVDQGAEAEARLSLVENALRADMHAVDTWRSVDTLMQGGASLAAAAATLGLSDREAQRMRLLAQIHPEVLAEMARGPAPENWILRDIVRASPERQLECMQAASSGKGDKRQVHWQGMAAGCKVQRLPRAWAVFPYAKSGIAWDRDLFVQPGDSQEWTTTDVEGFRAAQAAALAALVAGNPQAAVYEWRSSSFGPAVPQGWRQMRWFPEVPKAVPELAEDERFAVTMKDSGEAVAWVFRVPAEVAVATGTSDAAANPKPARRLTDAGLQMAATMKHLALRDALEGMRDDYDANETPRVLLRALLECLAAANVTPGAADKYAALEAIDTACPHGGEPSPSDLVSIATKTIGDMLIFGAPKTLSSGPVADDIAASLHAGQYLPRCDTPEFLAQCSGALLREAAQQVVLQPGQKRPSSVAALRDFLVGKLPDWRPVTFAAPVHAAAEGSANG